MTKYTLVKDKLYRMLDYYTCKVKNCKDFSECFSNIYWFIVETTEVINKSDLVYSDKIKLLKWVYSEITVLYMSYAMQSKKLS